MSLEQQSKVMMMNRYGGSGMKTEKPFRIYKRRYGGFCDDEPWYDEDEFILYEGDTCPQCKGGELKVSKNNKLYCSAICWIPDEPDIDQIEEGEP